MVKTHASAFDTALKNLQARHADLGRRQQKLALDLAGNPEGAVQGSAELTKLSSELTKLNTELTACGSQIAILREAQRVAANRDRVEAFEREKANTIKIKDDAIAAAKARVKVAEKIDAAFDTLKALLADWESLTEQVHQRTREVCVRTPPPGRKRHIHERMHGIDNAVQHSGATLGLSHRIAESGLGRRAIPVDMILGAGFSVTPTTVAASAEKGVAKLESHLQAWLNAAGTLGPAGAEEQTEG